MRLILLVLVAANLLALAGWQGWLDPWIGSGRDPRRLQQQVQPDRLQVLERRAVPPAAGGEAAAPATGPAPAAAAAAPTTSAVSTSSAVPPAPASPPANPSTR